MVVPMACRPHQNHFRQSSRRTALSPRFRHYLDETFDTYFPHHIWNQLSHQAATMIPLHYFCLIIYTSISLFHRLEMASRRALGYFHRDEHAGSFGVTDPRDCLVVASLFSYGMGGGDP